MHSISPLCNLRTIFRIECCQAYHIHNLNITLKRIGITTCVWLETYLSCLTIHHGNCDNSGSQVCFNEMTHVLLSPGVLFCVLNGSCGFIVTLRIIKASCSWVSYEKNRCNL